MKNLLIIFLGFTNVLIAQENNFGDNFDTKNVLASENIGHLLEFKGLLIQVQGEVLEVCQVSGCWMTLKLNESETMRVTFKDYGFFVPKDLAGSYVIINGNAAVKETSVEELKHYATDAGKNTKEIASIIKPETALSFVAEGVLQLNDK